MTNTTPAFEFDYDSGTIIYGRRSVDRLGTVLDSRDLERALIVCGSNVGANAGVMDPVRKGLGSTLIDVFDETTPAKYIQTAADGAKRIHEEDIDVLVCLGGGSSLDVAKVMCLVAASDRSFEDILEDVEETGIVPNPPKGAPVTSTVVIPTTLAGADMSSGGGIKLTSQPTGEPPLDDEVRSARFGDPRLTPEALFYDPVLFETTPDSVLIGSAMNGFDKGIETLYSGSLSPITDSTAIRGLKLLRESVPELESPDRSNIVLDQVVTGIILVQYGRQTSIIHAFGHGLSFYYPVQQGEAHGVLAPHVLRYVFEKVDGRRALIAEGLGIDPTSRSNDELAEAIANAVDEIREILRLPSNLRDLDGVEREHLRAIAVAIAADQNLERNPSGLKPNVDEIEMVLENAW